MWKEQSIFFLQQLRAVNVPWDASNWLTTQTMKPELLKKSRNRWRNSQWSVQNCKLWYFTGIFQSPSQSVWTHKESLQIYYQIKLSTWAEIQKFCFYFKKLITYKTIYKCKKPKIITSKKCSKIAFKVQESWLYLR